MSPCWNRKTQPVSRPLTWSRSSLARDGRIGTSRGLPPFVSEGRISMSHKDMSSTRTFNKGRDPRSGLQKRTHQELGSVLVARRIRGASCSYDERRSGEPVSRAVRRGGANLPADLLEVVTQSVATVVTLSEDLSGPPNFGLVVLVGDVEPVRCPEGVSELISWHERTAQSGPKTTLYGPISPIEFRSMGRRRKSRTTVL